MAVNNLTTMKTLPLGPELRARLCELLELDCTSPSGLHWKVSRGTARAGNPAGCFSKSRGYWEVRVDGSLYKAHRLIWALIHDEDPGDREIDHIDGDPSNNDPDNLRLATRNENNRNAKQRCDSTSNHKGVCRESQCAAWRGQISLNGKRITKNFSDSKYGGREAARAAAVEWVEATREELHGDFARHE